jgi:hypothetical protein
MRHGVKKKPPPPRGEGWNAPADARALLIYDTPGGEQSQADRRWMSPGVFVGYLHAELCRQGWPDCQGDV